MQCIETNSLLLLRIQNSIDMKKLIKILKKFDEKRTEVLDEKKWNKDVVADCFLPCAKEILLKGCFLINNKYIIDIGSIEFYYHEEEGEIKDHIMYHTNEHLPNKTYGIINKNTGYPYFELGSFNLHPSGIDVTFENPNKKYRASFLIRSYRVLERGDNPANLEKPFDSCSTHIFDDMFYSGILLGSKTVKWKKTSNKGGQIEQCPRKNVACYRKETDKKGIEKFVRVSKEEYEENKDDIKSTISKPQFFKYGENEYLQDTILWQFKREGIKEI